MSRLGLTTLAGVLVLLLAAITISAAGNAEIRSSITNLGSSEYTWNSDTFAGFYYDVNKNLGTEQISFHLSNIDPESATLSDVQDANGNRGIDYKTISQMKNFKFTPWGAYQVIGFLGDEHFAAYDGTETKAMKDLGQVVPLIFDKSRNRNLIANEQITRVLIDDDTPKYIKSNESLKLGEDYELILKSVNANETRAIVELRKRGQNVDTKIIQPNIEGATMADETYVYGTNIGDTKDIVSIAVHFKNIMHGLDTDSATVDGIFQISDMPTAIKADQQFGKMSIRTVDSNTLSITMDNKDNQIVLARNKDIPLMGEIHIKTADQSTIDESNPLRYYIYKEAICMR
jgi:S-layer protein (TIGR01567 family)